MLCSNSTFWRFTITGATVRLAILTIVMAFTLSNTQISIYFQLTNLEIELRTLSIAKSTTPHLLHVSITRTELSSRWISTSFDN